MKFWLRVYNGDELGEIEVSIGQRYFAGGAYDDDITLNIPQLPKGCFEVCLTPEGWALSSKSKLFRGLTGSKNPFGKIIVLDQQKKTAIAVYKTSSSSGKTINIAHKSNIIIGRGRSCDITIDSRQISGKHVELVRQEGTWYFQDLNSSNGTYLNLSRTKCGELSSDDVLSIGFCRINVSTDILTITCDCTTFVNFSSEPQVKKSYVIGSIDEPYPYLFRQSPRLRSDVPKEIIELETPPVLNNKPVINWLSVLLMPLLTVAVMFSICYFVTGIMTMLYFSVPMTLIGLLMTVIRYNGEKRRYRTAEQNRIKKYNEYLAVQLRHIETLIAEQKRIAAEENPSLLQCSQLGEGPQRTLWDRKFGDSDYMSLRIGVGDIPNSIVIKTPKQGFRLEDDRLSSQPADIAKKYKKIENCPILIHLKSHKSCGIIGDKSKIFMLGKNLLVQAAAHHSYEDLRIVVFCDQSEVEAWAFSRWLPHIFDDTRSIRYFANNPKQDKKLLEMLDEIFVRQATDNTNLYESIEQGYLFICASTDPMVNQTVSRYLTASSQNITVMTIFLAERLSDLPKDCYYIVDFTTGNVIYEKERASDKHPFTMDIMEKELYDKFARSLAPIRIETREKSRQLPIMVSFLQGYNAKTPQALNLEQNWSHAYPEQGMSVPIGVRDSGEPFTFDIHEKRSGPHGLVAGMTGAGKSEMVQSWILSMAVRFPPSAVSFVLIDFKGTGLLLPFMRLPHLAGTISDLDTSIGRNLIALENELQRRKTLLDQHKVSNIASYLRLYHEGRTAEALSYLFIVIDEFAEFKSSFPDFMRVIDRIFAIGRTLGVHMILLTQKPANVVDDKMNANTRFRWCLKVANSADSKDMLRHPDAAKIVNPGRAFVQVGEDEIFEQIQSYWSGAPYNPCRDLTMQRSTKVSVVDLYGGRMSYESEKTTGYRAEKNEIDAIVEYIDAYAQQNSYPRARAIWTSKLPENLHLRDILHIAFDGEKWNQSNDTLQPALGLLDDPRSQSQYPFYLDLPDKGHVAVYGTSGAGKTSFLHTTIMSLALSYPPDFVHMYLMDFGGGSFHLFKGIPHVGDVVVGGRDDEKVGKLSDMLLCELSRRKELISNLGLVNITSYNKISNETMPYITVIVDNFVPVLELYPELNTFFQTIGRDGGSCGVFLIITAHSANAFGYRISQNFKFSIALRMPDKGDYAPLVGRTNGLEPDNYPGRGLIRSEPPLEFQTALPADGTSEIERVDSIRLLTQMMNSAWKGKRADRIPVMPETVQVKDYPSNEVVLGIRYRDIGVCTIDMREQQFLLLSVAPDGNSPLCTVVQQTIRLLNVEEIIAFGSMEDRIIHSLSAEQFDQAIENLMPVLTRRKDAYASGPLSDEEYPYILILIDNLKDCFDQISDTTVRRLKNVVTLGRGLRVLMIVNGSAEEISHLHFCGDMFTNSLVQCAAALLIGDSARAHSAFDVSMSHTEVSAALTETDAYFLQSGTAEKIKVVQQ